MNAISVVIEFSKTLTMQYILHCLDHIGNLKIQEL